MALNQDQQDHFNAMKNDYINQIITESAFTMDEVSLMLKELKENKDEDLYNFLRSQKPSAVALKLYLSGLTRRTVDRVSESKRAAANPSAHKETFDKRVRASIGYSMSESNDRVVKELQRLKNKSDATWRSIEKAAKTSKKEILKHYKI